MPPITLTLALPPEMAALLERFVVAAERIATALEPQDVCARDTHDDWLRRHGLGDLIAAEQQDPRVDDAGAGQVQPSTRRAGEEGEDKKPASPGLDTPAQGTQDEATLAAGESPAPKTRWTVARKALLRRDYPAGVPAATILAGLNALPGPTVERHQVATYAALLKLKRPVASSAALRDAHFVQALPARPASPPEAKRDTRPAEAAPMPAISAGADAVAGDVAEMSYAGLLAFAAQHGLRQAALDRDLAPINRKRLELGYRPVRLRA